MILKQCLRLNCSHDMILSSFVSKSSIYTLLYYYYIPIMPIINIGLFSTLIWLLYHIHCCKMSLLTFRCKKLKCDQYARESPEWRFALGLIYLHALKYCLLFPLVVYSTLNLSILDLPHPLSAAVSLLMPLPIFYLWVACSAGSTLFNPLLLYL